jgi:hypothetical protein
MKINKVSLIILYFLISGKPGTVLGITFSIRNVGQLIGTFVLVYYLAKYKYFAFIFSIINAKFYI